MPLGMTDSRLELFYKQLDLAQGKDVEFTADEIAEMQIEAAELNRNFTPEQIMQMTAAA
jgi:hypothetical protein